jgi:hypothetical protein
MTFKGYTFTVQSEAIDADSRTFTVTLDGAQVVTDTADATSHSEVVEYLDTTPMAAAIAAIEAELAEDDGGDYYRQVVSDYYTDRI